MADHIPVEELADAAEDLVPAERAAEIDAHLHSCADCRGLADALAEVTQVLAGAPTPVMPPDVARRLDAVVAAESEHRAATGRPATAGSSGQAATDRTAPPRPRVARQTLGAFRADLPKRPFRRIVLPALAAAGAAAVVGFGAYVVSANAGLNEPPSTAVVVQASRLGTEARSLAQDRDLSPHRFSRAWQCAREVVHGRITGLATVTYDGEPALLVYTRDDDITSVTVVTGCNRDAPVAGPTAPLGR